MFGVIIENRPSFFSCDEMKDDYQLKISDDDKIYKWSEIKKKYNDWDFKEIDEKVLQKNKEKFKKVWNERYGRKICEELSRELECKIIFDIKNE